MAVWWGVDLTLLYNDAYIKFIGTTKHPSVLAHSGRTGLGEVWDQMGPMIEQVFTTGTATSSKDVAMSPIFGESGGVEGMVLVCTVVAEKMFELAQLDHAKAMFFSNISQEFRTPLTLMLGPLEELLARVEDPATQDQLSLIQRNSLRLQKLVNTLLDFSQIEAGRSNLTFEPAHLATTTADIASTFRTTIEHAGLELVIDCEPIAEWVYVDPSAWEKIVLHLLSNAFKYTFEGKITVSLRRTGDRVRLEVRDTGVGIPREELSRVFERFHRIEGQQSRSYEGSGIGLSLVQELVRMHGGSIDVISTPGAGSTFSVTLPLGHAHLATAQTEHLATPRAASTASDAFINEAMMWRADERHEVTTGAEQTKPRLLVADDNADMRAYLKQLLEPEFIVELVGDGTRALQVAIHNPPDLVLADVMMPGRDGVSLLRALRAEALTQSLPVILVSARTGEETRVEGMQTGANDHIVKPFSARELRARVRAQLELSSARLRTGTSQASTRAKDDFLSLFGHELRNPLSTVSTTLQVLMRQSPSIEVMVMDRAVRHLTRLVDNLLDLSRLQRGKIVLSRARVELGDVVAKALQRVGPELDERKITVVDGVPKSGMALDCDPERVAQVLAQVLRNAASFSPPGSKVTVEATRLDKRVQIVVRDLGAGIENERLPHVFDAFQNRGSSPGLGIGLAIARNLIHLHGGTIALHSAGAGRGTECQIDLPMDPAQVAVPVATPVDPSRKRKRVLLVEDNHDTATALQRALQSLGYEVALAHNGPVALTVARSFQPDVALLDIGLPVMDGWELSRRLRELRVPSRELHIVAVTARDQDTDKQRSAEAGFAEHLVKPIDLNRLERVVESLPDLSPPP